MNLVPIFALAISLSAFPAPKFVQVTDEMVCAWGSLNSNNGVDELVVRTEAGPLTVHVKGSTKFADVDGKELRTVADLKPGTSVRVYYVVDYGARAKEVDVIPAINAPE